MQPVRCGESQGSPSITKKRTTGPPFLPPITPNVRYPLPRRISRTAPLLERGPNAALAAPLAWQPLCVRAIFLVYRRLWAVEQLLPGSVFGSSRVFRRVPYSPVKCCWDGLGPRRGFWLPSTWRLLQPCAAQRRCCARARRNLTVVVLQEERQEHSFAERRRAAAAAAADGTRLYATWPSTQRCSGCTSSLTAAAATAASLAAAAGAAEAEEVAAGAAAAAAAAPTATACALSARRSRAATWTRCAAVPLPWGGAVDESLQPWLPGAGASLRVSLVCVRVPRVSCDHAHAGRRGGQSEARAAGGQAAPQARQGRCLRRAGARRRAPGSRPQQRLRRLLQARPFTGAFRLASSRPARPCASSHCARRAAARACRGSAWRMGLRCAGNARHAVFLDETC